MEGNLFGIMVYYMLDIFYEQVIVGKKFLQNKKINLCYIIFQSCYCLYVFDIISSLMNGYSFQFLGL